MAKPKKYAVTKTEKEWKRSLGAERFHILREKGTEKPFSGTYTLHSQKGTYHCGACEKELFSSNSKFDSSCGWPSFDKPTTGDAIDEHEDLSHGMQRTEVMCSRCGSHLGHVFNDSPTSTGLRYCINSLSIDFKDNT
jgi:peptide-methionine (R)-S-oxide reductase